jgi:hypothetical protein
MVDDVRLRLRRENDSGADSTTGARETSIVSMRAEIGTDT